MGCTGSWVASTAGEPSTSPRASARLGVGMGYGHAEADGAGGRELGAKYVAGAGRIGAGMGRKAHWTWPGSFGRASGADVEAPMGRWAH